MEKFFDMTLLIMEGAEVTLEIFFVTLILSLPNAADVAVVVRVLRVADGWDNVAGRGGGVACLHAQLRGVFCRSLSRRHSSNTARAVRGGKSSRTQALANDALHNFPASPARRPAANLQRDD